MKKIWFTFISLLCFLLINTPLAFSDILIWNQSFTPKEIESMEDTKAIIHTSFGDISISFFPQNAPNHVYNFIQLSKIGFYNKTLFHRVVPGFVIQGGDPNSRHPDTQYHGQGGPGYGYYLKEEFNEKLHIRGTLSMARSSNPDSAGSQFFICVADQPTLDGNYTVFGKVDEGIDVVDSIVSVPRDSNDNPIERIEMEVEIIHPIEDQVIGDINDDKKIGLEEAIHALQVMSGLGMD
jgi:peptidyl-prolyl cis-trans isomerase B (cyclophilin B)